VTWPSRILMQEGWWWVDVAGTGGWAWMGMGAWRNVRVWPDEGAVDDGRGLGGTGHGGNTGHIPGGSA
jgi:hypothetical protein